VPWPSEPKPCYLASNPSFTIFQEHSIGQANWTYSAFISLPINWGELCFQGCVRPK
jgi:hypothetical protein